MENEKTMDDKKSLKRERVKMYFLEAAKEIIINEGHEKVSVRKVADMAGYSYATIYNYFENLNELLWEVKGVMVEDLFKALQKKMHRVTYDIAEVKEGFKIYIEYYFENPNVFKFFYFYPLRKPSKKTVDTEAGPDFNAMWKETFKGLILEGRLLEKDIEAVAKTFIYAIHGLIMLCLFNNGDLTEENAYKELDKIVDYIL
ncbi:MAG TPA: TetR/AcrR family transcriptional regulator [Clostridia bacterium]|nr:TetR/AcrR family transcriptional regulator [Clostridia bacterium]